MHDFCVNSYGRRSMHNEHAAEAAPAAAVAAAAVSRSHVHAFGKSYASVSFLCAERTRA